jgi:excisionase family DNA binding protein
MQALTVIPNRGTGRKRPGNSRTTDPWERLRTPGTGPVAHRTPATIHLQRHPRPRDHRYKPHRGITPDTGVIQETGRRFTPLINAKAASTLLGVPYTWLLAQARAGAIPHHRLGHYVRFDPDDLHAWLGDTRIEPRAGYRGR